MTWLPSSFFVKIEIAANGCWNWTACKNGGYGSFRYQGKNITAHRLSWILHRGLIPKGLCVLHTCIGNPGCVNPNHLYLGNQKRNAADRLEQGREPNRAGELNGNAVLNAEQVREIAKLQGQVGARQVAARYGVKQSAVDRIWHGKAWNHLGVVVSDFRKLKPDRRGAKSSHPKLTENDALQIKALRGAVPQIVLQKRYGVSQGVVSGIQTGQRWPHLFLAPLALQN